MATGSNGFAAPRARSISLPMLREEVSQYRTRLLRQSGISTVPPSHFKRPVERPFTKQERGHVTLLFGGLTLRHEALVLAGFEGLGYKVELVPTPTKTDFQAGKEYGNNGQCNPTYFTVGALVNYLKNLRDREGMPTQDIIDNYVFLTAGACGPCRFGMYEAEYRLALRNSGFDGFRVLLFQQGNVLDQEDVEAGLEMSLSFFLSIINAVLMGDLLNEVAYHIRPYEVHPGSTDDVLTECISLCQDKLRKKNYDEIHGGKLARLLSRLASIGNPDDVEKFVDQLRGTYFTDAFAECARLINDRIEVDYTVPRPIAKVTGEFWAQTTEGDGNFRMFRFLEREGAEVLVEPIATWIAYLLNQARMKQKDRRGLAEGEAPPARWDLKKKWALEKRYQAGTLKLKLADRIIVREYERLRKALGGTAHELVDQNMLVRMAHPFYNARSGGGEGHLEVAKNIFYCNRDLAHMVLSLKPFGCMPSTQSDGAQSAVVALHPDMIYLPIETSGEGDINAHSRVQMALGEAKAKAKDEFQRALRLTGYSVEQIRQYVALHRALRRPIQRIPHADGFVGRAANFVLHVGALMDRDGPRAHRRSRARATRQATSASA